MRPTLFLVASGAVLVGVVSALYYQGLGIAILVAGVILLVPALYLGREAPTVVHPLTSDRLGTVGSGAGGRSGRGLRAEVVSYQPTLPVNPPAPPYASGPVNPVAPLQVPQTFGRSRRYVVQWCVRCGAPVGVGARLCGTCLGRFPGAGK